MVNCCYLPSVIVVACTVRAAAAAGTKFAAVSTDQTSDVVDSYFANRFPN